MIKYYWLRSLCFFSLILNLALAAAPAQAQTTPPVTVRIAPTAIEIPLGQTADVAVEVVDAQDLYGFDLALTFNPDMVEVVDADPGRADVQAALGTFLDSGFVVLNTADNVSGTLHFVMTQLNPSPPKSGTGTLIVVRLRGKQVNGGTPLTLNKVQLARRDGSVLSPTPISGQVSVVASAGSSPTRTPIPTQGAGTPMPTSTPLSSTATAVPPIGSTTAPPTVSVLVTDPSASITPVPTNQPAATTGGAPTQSPAATSTPDLRPENAQSPETPTPPSMSTVTLGPASTSTSAAVAAVVASPTPVNSPANSSAAIQVPQQPAASAPGSTGSATTLLAVSGIVGLIGIATVWFVLRRRSQ